MLPAFTYKPHPARLHEKRQRIRRKRFVRAWKHWEEIHGATLLVPEDHELQNARQIVLTYAILSRKNKHVEKPPILILNGGPGIPALQGIPFWLNSSLREEHDLILMDQRGTDFSSGLPNIASEFFKIMAGDLSREEECQKMRELMEDFPHRPVCKSIDLSAYQAYQSVEDVARLMTHLDYDRFHILGLSHGTKLGSILMDRYPDLIASSVLYGPWTICAGFFENLAANFWEAWRWYLLHCGDIGNSCPQSQLEEVLSLGKKSSIKIRIKGKPFVLNERDILYFLRYYLYFPNAVSTIPAFLKALIERDLKQLQILSRRPLRMLSGEVNMTAYAASLAYDECRSVSDIHSNPDRHRQAGFPSEIAFFPPFARHLSSWQSKQATVAQKELGPNQIPSLILVHEGDPVTPPWQGRQMQQILTNSELRLFPECGHVYLEESKFAIMKAFFSAH